MRKREGGKGERDKGREGDTSAYKHEWNFTCLVSVYILKFLLHVQHISIVVFLF